MKKKPVKCKLESRTKGSVPLSIISIRAEKNQPALNIYFIPFLVFVVIVATEYIICVAIMVREMWQTDGQRSLSNRVPF